MRRIFFAVWPYYEYRHKSKVVRNRIQKINKGEYDGNLQYVEAIDGFREEDILKFYDHTREIKRSLEDKSKSILFAITVSITLAIGLATLLMDEGKYVSGTSAMDYFIFGAGLASVIYMLMGGLLALSMMSGRMEVYQLFPADLRLDQERRARLIAWTAPLA